jgi:hypothetical protein
MRLTPSWMVEETVMFGKEEEEEAAAAAVALESVIEMLNCRHFLLLIL